MNTEKIIKEAKLIMVICLTVGLVLLVAGIIVSFVDVSFITNPKAVIGLSIIPLSGALVYYLKLTNIKKSPQKMKNIIISESDERLVALKNEADAKAFKLVQAVIFLGYMAYTLMVPEDIFESVGWWIIMVILMVTFIAQGVLRTRIYSKKDSEE
jgi:vacuolar-type H+-ATPase subunit I/STV1